MKVFTLVLILMTSTVAIAQKKSNLPKLTIQFASAVVMQLDSKTDSLVDQWQNSNSCTYSTNRKQGTVSYEEKDQEGNVVKSWNYHVLRSMDDYETYTFEVDAEDRVIFIVVWKDKSMVAIQDVEWNYLISN